MQVFKAFWKVALRNLGFAIMYFGIFLGVVMLISTILSSEDNQTQFGETKLKVCVMDEDHSALSEALAAYLFQTHTQVTIANDKESIQDALFQREVDYILQIPQDFNDAFVAGEEAQLTNIKIPGGFAGVYVDQAVEQYLSSIRLLLAGGSKLSESIAHTNEILRTETEVRIETFSEEVKTSKDGKLYYFFLYCSYAFPMIFINALCAIAISLNKPEVLLRNACGALSARRRNVQYMIGNLTYGMGTWLLFLLAAVVIFGINAVSGSNLRYVINSLAFLVVSLGAAYLLCCLVRKKELISLVANVIGLGMCFLCGAFVPQWLLGEKLLLLSKFLPAYWYVKATNMIGDISGYPYSSSAFFVCIMIQLLFSGVLFGASFLVTAKKRT